jgi:hypothetical protein
MAVKNYSSSRNYKLLVMTPVPTFSYAYRSFADIGASFLEGHERHPSFVFGLLVFRVWQASPGATTLWRSYCAESGSWITFSILMNDSYAVYYLYVKLATKSIAGTL